MQSCWVCGQLKPCKEVSLVVRNASDQEDLLDIGRPMCKNCRSYMPLLLIEDKASEQE